ncbi:MAG: FtsX-like permease family protein [Pseudomonadota bacterium]|nr:FtsX-like permease family protein [Pseudomonadota bacterium]
MIVETLRLAAASLARNPRRTLLTAGALANAVVGGLLFYGFTRHSYFGLAETFARGGNGHVQIADADWFDAPAPERHRVERTRLEAARAALAADPVIAAHLAGSSVRRQVMGMLTSGGRTGVFVGVGTEPDAEPIIAPVTTPVTGRALTGADTAAVVLGVSLGARLEVGAGDFTTALVTTDRGLTNAMDLEVAGLAKSGAEELDRSLATMPLETALSLVDGTTVDVLVLALDETGDTDLVLDAARRVLAAQGYDELAAEPWYTRATYYQAVRALYDRIFGVFEALMALVTVLSLSHAVAAVVAERKAEIAMLRVVGLRRRDVAGLFVAEGALLGLLGAVAGVGIAEVIRVVTERMGGIPMPPPPGYSVGYAAMFAIDGLGYAIVLPVTMVAAVLAAALPAWRATRGELSRGLAGLVALFVVGAWATDAWGAPPNGTAGTAAGAVPLPAGSVPTASAADLAAATALLRGADAATALPAGQRCVLDVTITDPAGVTGWRVARTGTDALVVSSTLAAGRRQAVLQRGADTWFQTEAMRAPMRVGAAQRLTGQLSVGDLLAPRLGDVWDPVGLARGAQPNGATITVTANARPGAGAAWASADLDLDASGLLRGGRFYAPSGKLLRTATWRWEGRALRGVDVLDPTRADAHTVVALSTPRCAASAAAVAPETLLAAGLALLGE